MSCLLLGSTTNYIHFCEQFREVVFLECGLAFPNPPHTDDTITQRVLINSINTSEAKWDEVGSVTTGVIMDLMTHKSIKLQNVKSIAGILDRTKSSWKLQFETFQV